MALSTRNRRSSATKILFFVVVVVLKMAQGWTMISNNPLTQSQRKSSVTTTMMKTRTLSVFPLQASNTEPSNDDKEEDEEMKKKRKAFEQAASEFQQQKKMQSAAGAGTSTNPKKKLVAAENEDDDENDNDPDEEEEGLLDKLNPFKAGQKLRQTLDSALSTLGSTTAGISSERRSVYYLEDHFSGDSALLFAERNPSLERWLQQQRNSEDFVPEILVIGATGDIGQLVVRRLLLEANCRVRVLVQDLYSKTLNLLGTGVTYCQGDLNNMDSLEYAVTDVDKIIFCAAAPRPDEPDFQDKFQSYCQETLKDGGECLLLDDTKLQDSSSWDNVESVLELRAKLAEQVDMIGLQNVVRAYLNVRHADYGTSQAAKRSLFKFQDRPEDFNLFAIDDDDDDTEQESSLLMTSSSAATASSTSTTSVGGGAMPTSTTTTMTKPKIGTAPVASFDPYATIPTVDEWKDDYAMPEDDDYYARMNKELSEQDPYADYYGSDPTTGTGAAATTTTTTIEQPRDAAYKATCQWIRNAFGHGVFVGKVPKATKSGGGGEAAIVSSRLRASRGDPDSDQGIDLGTGFAGFVCRVCSDGGNYEAFIRTGLYETDGIEYVCEFNTITKPTQKWNKSPNKFKTIRLDFENFKPVQRKTKSGARDSASIPTFNGKDIRRIGFRYRSSANPEQSSSSSYFATKADKSGSTSTGWSNFYLALCYIKVYRSQPEPEFVYVSDARIPPVVKNGMVRHDARQIVGSVDDEEGGESVYRIFDEATLESVLVKSNKNERTPEETYFKFRGEEILKNSGISYSIVRIWGLNDSPSGEASSLELAASNEDLSYVSRAEVAQVCARALVDPNALNKSFYLSKTKRSSAAAAAADVADLLSAKFAALPADANP